MVQFLERSILLGRAGEDWMGPTPSKSGIFRDPGAVLSFLEIYCSEIYVCSPHIVKFEKWDPCTMGTWVNSFWEISP